ncbi:MAG: hypothetical protein K6L73_13785 [Cellvibrionaceae bacterium]
MNTALIVILLVLVAAGPIMWLRPTPAQKKQIRLRQLAMSKGMKVELRAPPGEANTDDSTFGWVAYTLCRDPGSIKGRKPRQWTLFRSGYEHELNYYGVWRWLGGKNVSLGGGVPKLLDALPECVSAVSVNPGGGTVFWREQGDEAEVLAIESALAAVLQQELDQGY